MSNITEMPVNIKNGKAVLLYFSSTMCGVCKVLKPKLQLAITESLPKITFVEIKSEEHNELATQYNVLSAPTIIVLFEGKEFYRENGNLSIPMFIEKLKRPYNLMF